MQTFKVVRTYLTSQETALKFMNAIGPLAEKTPESSVFLKRSDWIIFFQVFPAGSSCRTVKELLAFLFKAGFMNEIMNCTGSCTNLATHLTC